VSCPILGVLAFSFGDKVVLTGWRVPSEILTLRWKQVDFSAGMVRLEPGTTKNDEGRVFPFGVLPEPASLLRARWEQALSLEMETGQSIPWVFHWNDRGTFKEIHPKALYHRSKGACRLAGVPARIPHDFRRTAVRNLERAGVPRSVAMKLTGHKTEAVYRRYAIVCEADLTEGLKKLAVLEKSLCRTVELSHSLATISKNPSQKAHISREKMAVGPVSSQPVSVYNSLEQGKIQGISGMAWESVAAWSAETTIPHQFLRVPGIAPFYQNRELTRNFPHK
jgi:integrase-like protein